MDHTKRRMLKLPEVCDRTGIGRASIYSKAASGTFPSPVKLGPRASAWPEDEVDNWIEARIAERDTFAV